MDGVNCWRGWKCGVAGVGDVVNVWEVGGVWSFLFLLGFILLSNIFPLMHVATDICTKILVPALHISA